MHLDSGKLSDYFNMIQLLSSVAQVAPIPMKMLRSIATPYHVRLLCELLMIENPANKVRIIQLFDSHIKNRIPAHVFKDALAEPLI